MKPETLTALKASIVKWKKNSEIDHVDQVKMGIPNCPLCMIFNVSRSRDDTCIGCPVEDKTGQIYCNSTPYSATVDCFDDWEESESSTDLGDAFREAALAEHDFLVSLLPEGEVSNEA